jgi:hypothetical protein
LGFLDWLTGGVNHEGDKPNANPPSSVGSGQADGDPHGVEIVGPEVEARALPGWHPSPWAGWPAGWSTPNWDFGSRFNELVDVAWNCLDKNASVLSTMPVYRTRGGQVMPPAQWMTNPDPTIYTDWTEFAKQLFWDYQLGEAFIAEMSTFSDGYPMRFRVVPPWGFHVEMVDGERRYRLGGPTGPDVTSQILHIRYKSTTADARGVGPLESAGGRMLTAGLLQKYVREFAATGGVPLRSIETEMDLTPDEAKDLQEQYMASRVQNAIAPPVFDHGGKLKDHPLANPKDAAMVEVAQWNEAKIANLLGVPPFLVGLPSGGDSMTYSNVSMLFDFHDRSYLRTAATRVMAALSYWALARGQAAELNRDEYSRPSFDQRAPAWEKLAKIGAVTPEQVARYERFQGGTGESQVDEDAASEAAMTAITGGEQ